MVSVVAAVEAVVDAVVTSVAGNQADEDQGMISGAGYHLLALLPPMKMPRAMAAAPLAIMKQRTAVRRKQLALVAETRSAAEPRFCTGVSSSRNSLQNTQQTSKIIMR